MYGVEKFDVITGTVTGKSGRGSFVQPDPEYGDIPLAYYPAGGGVGDRVMLTVFRFGDGIVFCRLDSVLEYAPVFTRSNRWVGSSIAA